MAQKMLGNTALNDENEDQTTCEAISSLRQRSVEMMSRPTHENHC